MRQILFSSLIILWVALSNFGCQESIIVGSDLLKDEKIIIDYKEDFQLQTITLDTQRILTYYSGLDNQTYLLGHLNDDVFGRIEADLYLNVYMGSTKANYGDITEPKQFDSLVLLLQYDTLGFYPKSYFSEQKIEIFQLNEAFPEVDSAYSDFYTASNDIPIFSKNMKLSAIDSISIVERDSNKVVKLAPHFRARLDDAFGRSLFENSSAASTDSEFSNFFKGLYIKSDPSFGNSLAGFNINDASLSSAYFTNKLVLYYTVSDTIKKQYTYFLSSRSINQYQHDKSGSQLALAINDTMISDIKSYIEGTGGSSVKIKFQDLESSLLTKSINQAILEFSVEDLSSNLRYDSPAQILAFREDDGEKVLIKDFSLLSTFGLARIRSDLGGIPIENTDGSITYQINITNHIKSFLEGEITNADIILSPAIPSERPNKAIILGPKSTDRPMKLKVIFTEN
ncbi:MAG: DUF4270 family protein [Saprospiraceae bacterium]